MAATARTCQGCGLRGCCLQDETATDMSAEDCQTAGGKVLDNILCDPLCCDLMPYNYVVPEALCNQDGTPMQDEECDLVCCPWIDGQFFQQSTSDCDETPVDGKHCEGNMVCCDTGEGEALVATSECLPGKGLPRGANECGDICCYYQDDGVSLAEVMSGIDCQNLDGAYYVKSMCDEVCCLNLDEQAYQLATVVECGKTGNPVEADHCEEVCCLEGGNALLKSKGDCTGEALPEASCKLVCCPAADPKVQPTALCDEPGEWADCPGYCDTALDCGSPSCSDDFSKVQGWTCVNYECVAAVTDCEGNEKCVGGACAAIIQAEFVVPGYNCPYESVDFPGDTDWEKTKFVRMTITHNSISCCASSGCGGFNPETGPTPCDFPITVTTGEDFTVNVDVSQWSGNVGQSYVVPADKKYISAHYTDTWCSDNYPAEPWNETIPGNTVFAVAALTDVCCKLTDTSYGFAPASECDKTVPVELCAAVEVCCGEAEPTLKTALDCANAGLAPVPANECSEVCCVGGVDGDGILTPNECDIAGGTPQLPGMCKEGCCKSDGTYSKKTLPLCIDEQGGVPVADGLCDDICCYLGIYQTEVVPKGACKDKGWNIDEDVSQCDYVCCNVWGEYEARFRLGCGINDVVGWGNCPGKCNTGPDCGAPKCSDDDPPLLLDWECTEGNCVEKNVACPDGQMCAGGGCS